MRCRKRPLDGFGSAAQGFGVAAPQMAVGELCDDGGVHLVIVEAIQPFVTFTGMPSRR
jgi:hypothetical protein